MSLDLVDYTKLELSVLQTQGYLDANEVDTIKAMLTVGTFPEMRKVMQKLEKALTDVGFGKARTENPPPQTENPLPTENPQGISEAAQKLLVALTGHPALAWELHQKLRSKLLSPWHWSHDGEGSKKHAKAHRDYPGGSGVVACRIYQHKLQESHDAWSWAVFAGRSAQISGSCHTQQEALRIVDGHLEGRGYILGQ